MRPLHSTTKPLFVLARPLLSLLLFLSISDAQGQDTLKAKVNSYEELLEAGSKKMSGKEFPAFEAG